MGELYNQKNQTQRRKELRNNQTYAEKLLWSQLSGKELGYKFRRQFGIGPFILDFYCPHLRLAIEVDGDSHFLPEGIAHDLRRTKYLVEKGVRELRFTNDEVYYDLDSVIERLKNEIQVRPLPTSGSG